MVEVPKHYHPCRWRCEKFKMDVILEDVHTPILMMNHSCGARLIETQWAEPKPTLAADISAST